MVHFSLLPMKFVYLIFSHSSSALLNYAKNYLALQAKLQLVYYPEVIHLDCISIKPTCHVQRKKTV